MRVVEDSRPPAIFLQGPTAAGKTGMAVELVERFGVQIISVDSALVYRGMDIGTAKPDATVLERAPHRLIDIRDPREAYSAAEFRSDALREMQEIHAAGQVPLLAGGTMLYFRALTRGLAPMPSADPGLRERLDQQGRELGWAVMHERLARLDPVAAARIHPNDPQRIQRALEVIELTGKPLSMMQQEGARVRDAFPFRVLQLVICPSQRSVLHQRIEHRFQVMLDHGFMEEMRGLFSRGDLAPEFPSMRCVGYRQGWQFLAGEVDFPTMRRKALTATRQLAKRQLTWLRQESAALWYDLEEGDARESLLREVAAFLET